MNGQQGREPDRTVDPAPTGLVKNTFAPNCDLEYFTPKQLLTLCRFGFPKEKMPPGARRVADQMIEKYLADIEARKKSGKPRPRIWDIPVAKRIRDTMRNQSSQEA